MTSHDPKALHTAAVAIQTVLLIMFTTPAADSLHLAAIFCLPASAVLLLCTYCDPSLFIKVPPGSVCSLIVTQVSPMLAGRADTAQVLGREVAEDVMQVSRCKSGD